MDSTGSSRAAAPDEDRVLLFPPFRLDPADQRLWNGERPVPLKSKSFSVLHHLLMHAGRLVTKQELLDAVWHDVHVGDTSIKTAIKEIRRALGDSTEAPRFVATVHRHGYRFIYPVEPWAGDPADPAARPSAFLPEARSPTPPSAPRASFRTHEGHRNDPKPEHASRSDALAGREAELSSLHNRLAKARAGERHLVFVSGPPGIGKSALLDAFLASLADRPDLWLARGQCLPHIGRGEPYLPMLDILGSLCRDPDGAAVQAVLARYAPAWLSQLPALLTDAELDALQRRASATGPKRMPRQMAEAIEALSAERPMVLCFDDLQWCDRATLELIDTLVRRQPKARLLIVGAYRSTEMPDARHPVLVLRQEMQIRGLCEALELEPLPKAAVTAYCAGRFGVGSEAFASSLPGLVHDQSGGHPLFMAALVDDLVRRGEIVHRDGRWELAAHAGKLALPASIVEFVAGQFERLDADTRRLLEAASVLGPEFTVNELAAALLDETGTDDLEALAMTTARRRLFLAFSSDGAKAPDAAGARLAFRHDLYREVVYARLAPGRRATLHRRVGEWRERVSGDRAGEIAGTLAVHFEACGDRFRAARYLRLAGEQARRRHAPRAAADHARRGIALIQGAEPSQARIREELLLRQLLAVALVTSDGFATAELAEVYAGADELCRQIEDRDSAVIVLCGFWNLALNRGDGARVRDVTGRLLSLAREHPEPVAMLQAHNVAAQTGLFTGEFAMAERHLERCLALYDVEADRRLTDSYGESPGVVIHLAAGWMRWAQGHPGEARRHVEAALGLGRAVDRPFAVEQALWGAAVVHQHCGDIGHVHDATAELIRLCRNTGPSLWLGGARILRGWALARGGRARAGIASLRRGLAQWRATGTLWLTPYYLCLLADALSIEEEDEEAFGILAEAGAIIERTGERWYDAELLRLRGELTRRREAPQAAERHFRQALAVSRRQGARSWELRAATALADLWRQQGRVSEGYRLLAPICDDFADGFDTADLKSARALLDALRR